MGILGWLRRIFKSRKYPRYYVSKGTFVVVKKHTSHGKEMLKIQILDISEGGCAFVYNGTREELAEAGFLSLISGDKPQFDRVDYVTASDVPVPDKYNTSGWLRRRGVNFKWLGIFDRKRLQEFISQNTIGRLS
jgi:c-di-GMP-binding flagellar brake protein YcgR